MVWTGCDRRLIELILSGLTAVDIAERLEITEEEARGAIERAITKCSQEQKLY